jgi:hypothetical protein
MLKFDQQGGPSAESLLNRHYEKQSAIKQNGFPVISEDCDQLLSFLRESLFSKIIATAITIADTRSSK